MRRSKERAAQNRWSMAPSRSSPIGTATRSLPSATSPPADQCRKSLRARMYSLNSAASALRSPSKPAPEHRRTPLWPVDHLRPISPRRRIPSNRHSSSPTKATRLLLGASMGLRTSIRSSNDPLCLYIRWTRPRGETAALHHHRLPSVDHNFSDLR